MTEIGESNCNEIQLYDENNFGGTKKKVTYNELMTIASDLVRTVTGHTSYSSIVFSTMKTMIAKSREDKPYEVIFNDLDQLPIVNVATSAKKNHPLPAICHRVTTANNVKRKKLGWNTIIRNPKKRRKIILNYLHPKVIKMRSCCTLEM